MSITTVFDFTNPLNYILSNITVDNDIAELSLVADPNQTFTQSFAASGGFTFDANATSIGGGTLEQVAYPAFFPTFTNLMNTVSNNPGELTKTGGGTAYNAGANTSETLDGSGYFEITAVNVFGTVSGLSTSSNTNGDYVLINYGIVFATGEINIIELGVTVQTGITPFVPGDIFRVQVTGSTVTYLKNGTVFYTSLTAVPSFPLYGAIALYTDGGTVTGIKLKQNLTNYIGDVITFPTFNYSGLGSVVGFTGFTTASDVNSPRYILNGLYYNGMAWVSSDNTYAQANPKTTVAANIGTHPNNNSLTIKVLTTDNDSGMSITGPLVVTYSGQIYPTAGGTIISNGGLTTRELISFASQASTSGGDTVTYALKVNNVLKYWNGSAWVNSNGTAAQTNTPSQITTNAASLLSVNSSVKVYALLVSGDGSTTPSLTTMTVVYDFGALPPNPLETTMVYGFLADIEGEPVVGAQIIFSLVNTRANAYMEAAGFVLMYGSVTAVTDENGFFEQPIIATTQFEGNTTFVQVVIKKTNSVLENVGPTGEPLYLTIPIQASIDITSLLTA